MKKLLLIVLMLCFCPFSVDAQSLNMRNANTQVKRYASNCNIPKPIKDLAGNYNNEVKVIFSDIDATIVPLSNRGVQPKTPAGAVIAADKLKETGIDLILATGRSSNEIEEIAAALGRDNTYYILLQGAAIMSPDRKIIYEDYMSKRVVKKVIKGFENFKKKNGLNSNFYIVVDGEQYSNEPFVLPYNGHSAKVFKSLDELGRNVSVSKISIYEPNSRKNKMIQDYLSKTFHDLRIELAGSGYCDVSSPTATKGNAIKFLSEKLGYDLKNSAVFGDSENDISMFKFIKLQGGVTISVANAILLLKQNSDYVTAGVYDNGFGKGVEEILKNNQMLNEKNLQEKN